MKALFTSLLLVLFLLNSREANADPKKLKTIKISGKFSNPSSDSIIIQNSNNQTIKRIKVNPDGSFSDKLKTVTGYYTIGDGNEHTALFLKPGFKLHLTLKTEAFDESIVYKGTGEAENNYLAQKYLLEEGFGNLIDYGYYAKLNEADFLKLQDSLYTVRLNFLRKNESAYDRTFFDYQMMLIDCNKREKLYNYESMHAFLTKNKTFKVSETFPDPFAGFDLSNEAWINSYEYIDMVDSYLENKASTDIQSKKSSDYYMTYLNLLDAEISSKLIKEKLAYKFGMNRLTYVKDLEEKYKQAIAMIVDSVKRNEVSGLYLKLKNLVKGAPSPKFNLPDSSGKIHSIESLKGKYVYIDVWATWCGPCMYELPFLNALEDSLVGKNIEFVSICAWDEQNNWMQMLRSKAMGGLQLFASTENSSFLTNYVIQGIPRFILLDKEGNIIDANAKRPSQPELLKELLLLLE